jgi:hypothetical protein
VSEQDCRENKNPPDQLRRVYDIFYPHMHITVNSPESKYENDDVGLFCNTFLKIVNAKIEKN